MEGSSRDGGRERQGRRFSILGEMRRAAGDEQGAQAGRSRGRGRKAGKKQTTKDRGQHRRRQANRQGGRSRSGRRSNARVEHGKTVTRQESGATGQRSHGRGRDRSLPDPFELFMAYHLGIGADGRYKATNIHEVARRFHTSVGGIRSLLAEYGMDSDAVINSSFDMAMAQYDIQVAPDGVDVVELAKNLYQEFRSASRNTRNWEEELARDAAANAEIYGKK